MREVHKYEGAILRIRKIAPLSGLREITCGRNRSRSVAVERSPAAHSLGTDVCRPGALAEKWDPTTAG